MNKLLIKKVLIEISVNDITKIHADVIVLPTNNRLLPSGFLRSRVITLAGSKVQRECNSAINKINQLPKGQAVITSGGCLDAKSIIHVNIPPLLQFHMTNSSQSDPKGMVFSIWNCLKLAESNKFKSLVFPPLTKEMIGYNVQSCANMMLSILNKYFIEKKTTTIKKIHICLETLPEYEAFENEMENLSQASKT